MNLWFEGELQHIIPGDEPAGQASQLKKVQRFLKSNEGTSFVIEKQQRSKSKEAVDLNSRPHSKTLQSREIHFLETVLI